jgi:signal transduction histidine kinase
MSGDHAEPPRLPLVLRYVVHDLANVLLLIEASARGDSPEMRAIRGAALLGAELLRSLRSLDESSREGGCQVDAALEPCAVLLGRLGEARGVAVEVACGSETVRLAAFELQDVVINLALNAIEAMADGGRLAIRSEVAGDQLQLSVVDTGPGIPSARLDGLLGDRATTKPGHSGLGLGAVQSVVQRAGGRVEVSSQLGAGTTVVLVLPLG